MGTLRVQANIFHVNTHCDLLQVKARMSNVSFKTNCRPDPDVQHGFINNYN